MEALVGLVTVLLVLGVIAILDNLPIRRRYVRDERQYAREHFVEECAGCDEDIYIWQGRFLHVSTDQPEASTPYGKPHRVMPWSVHELMRQALLEDEKEMMKGKRRPYPIGREAEADELTLKGYCPGCTATVTTIVRASAWDRWKNAGEPFVDAFPRATVADRARLEIGWHGDCYRSWWGDVRRHEPCEDAA